MRKNNVPASGVQYRVVTVTPDLAEKWLSQNIRNRNLRDKAIMAYARDMEAGNWAENGEGLKFAKGGVLLLDGPQPLYGGPLLDGQHRLHAICLSGVTLTMLVVTGLEGSAQETMDDGRKRTLADALNLRNESNSVILGALLRRALMWEMGQFRNTGAYTPTNAECLAFLEDHPECRESALIAAAVRKPSKLPASILGLTHWLFTGIDRGDSVWFFDRLASGAELRQYHPVWTLRKRATELADETGRIPEDMLLAFVIKAWNAYRDGTELRLLRFKPGGATAEKFPLPR
ncbi:hypothetical protein ACFWIB_14490 [Streptomyces sp. NPDC127051]|uniref:hypothetical protein n=1 Tax=Streptomyces sp. NPDC127051 TaxID=3347119 RepID=UPI00364FDE16